MERGDEQAQEQAETPPKQMRGTAVTLASSGVTAQDVRRIVAKLKEDKEQA
ncbi:MAG: hypothetical protein KC425_18705 [Anaerolineales bacterium]|nr:hypothetical protein [Anaerolineales bacterium]